MSKKKQAKKAAEETASSKTVPGKDKVKLSANNTEKNTRRNIYYLIVILAFLLYGNTIPNEYAMDDELVTLDHPVVSKGIAGIPEIFTSRYVQNDQQSYEYRPIVLVSYAIEHQFTGGNVHFSHFINVVLYALTGILLFHILSMLFIQFHWILPLSVTLFFFIHPIHSEVVASLKNRDEILSFIFTLLSIRSVLLYFDKSHWKYLVYGLLFFIIAMLSKKSALPLVFTLPVILYFFRNVSLKKALLFFIIPVASFFLINFMIRSGLESVNRPGLFFENPYYVDKPGFVGKLPMAFYSMGYYIKLLFLPYPLLVYYGYSYVEMVGWENIWAILSAVFFVAGGIYCLLNFTKKNILVFGFLYFTFNIGAFSNMMPMPGIIADRFAYGASLGFSIVIVYLVLSIFKVNLSKNAELKLPASFKYSFVALALICNIYIFQRNQDWKNHLTIYLADVEKAPDSAKINALIGGYCMQTLERIRSGKSTENLSEQDRQRYISLSKKHFSKAIEIYPDYVASLNNMGTLYFSYIGELDTAAYYFDRVLKLEPDHVQANFNMGSFYEMQYSAYVMMENHYTALTATDSLDRAVFTKEKKYEEFLSNTVNYYRTGNIAFNDLSRNFQQFINDSRNSGGKIDKQLYIDGINNYWLQLMTKLKMDPTHSLQPGGSMIEAITSSTTNNPNEFSMMLRNTVISFFLKQFEPMLLEEFEKIFNRRPEINDYFTLKTQAGELKQKAINDMIRVFNKALFAEKPFPPSYQKLSQLYLDQKMWDSLIVMNQRIQKSETVARLTDVYRQMGTGYFYSKKEKEGIKYFEMSIAEEEKILKKAQISLQHQSAAGNSVAVQKLNQLVMTARSNVYNLIMNVGAMYDSIGEKAKAEEQLKKSELYKN